MCFIFVLPYTSTYNTVHAWKSAQTRYLICRRSVYLLRSEGHLLSYVEKLKKKAPVSPPAQHMRSFSAGMCVQLQGSARAPLAVNWGSANAALIGVQRARPAPDPGGEIRGATRSRGAIGRPGLSPCAQRLLPSPRGVARQLAWARGRNSAPRARRRRQAGA